MTFCIILIFHMLVLYLGWSPSDMVLVSIRCVQSRVTYCLLTVQRSCFIQFSFLQYPLIFSFQPVRPSMICRSFHFKSTDVIFMTSTFFRIQLLHPYFVTGVPLPSTVQSLFQCQCCHCCTVSSQSSESSSMIIDPRCRKMPTCSFWLWHRCNIYHYLLSLL